MKAWITKDERYPDYYITTEDNSTATEVEITTEQLRIAKRYTKLQEQFEKMCRELLNESKKTRL